MNTNELKQATLKHSFGGVMYDVSEGSVLRQLVSTNKDTALKLADDIAGDRAANGVDKGIYNFISDCLVA